ncbi:MAG: type II toxin-antitoxin system VapC family toxin [Agathobacter sp.]|nr:type II toxin-antitoxin system VapC family toxin [Agathobacter sp.]MDY4892592.1 type II toxin-antitoxin system VapC family toxin [Agathobacter sp.]
MRLLLDTHIILWTLNDNPKLSKEARKLILDPDNEIYYSTASIWETTIKFMSKPDKIHISGTKLAELCNQVGFRMVPISDNHVRQLETLRYHKEIQDHNDPFDRIMICQAKAEGFRFVTHDTKIPFYQEPCVISV